MNYSWQEIQAADQKKFVEMLGFIYEDTPIVAAKAWEHHPFRDLHHLQEIMTSIVNNFSETEKLTLLCAHPDLGSRVKMGEASVEEQTSIGLQNLTPEEYDLFQALNCTYRDRFGFPFIIAVRNHSKQSILDNFALRLNNDRGQEIEEALAQVTVIASLRLQNLLI